MSNRTGRATGLARRAPQHRKNTGRHREPAPTVDELAAVPGTAGAKIATAGVIGTTAAFLVPAAAMAADGPAAGPPSPTGVQAKGCTFSGNCGQVIIYNNGGFQVGVGEGTPGAKAGLTYDPPPTASSVGVTVSRDAPGGRSVQVTVDSSKGLSWEAGGSKDGAGVTVGGHMDPETGQMVPDDPKPSTDVQVGTDNNVIVYYQHGVSNYDPNKITSCGDGCTSYPPNTVPPSPDPNKMEYWADSFRHPADDAKYGTVPNYSPQNNDQSGQNTTTNQGGTDSNGTQSSNGAPSGQQNAPGQPADLGQQTQQSPPDLGQQTQQSPPDLGQQTQPPADSSQQSQPPADAGQQTQPGQQSQPPADPGQTVQSGSDQFTNSADPTGQDPGGNIQMASNQSSQSSSMPAASSGPQSSQVASAGGASSGGYSAASSGGGSSDGFDVASSGGASSGGASSGGVSSA
jgi:hypothetical protein